MDTTYDLLIKKLSKQASVANSPLNGTFELTARCNLNCRMCYIHNPDSCAKAEGELTTQQWIDLASDARDAGMLNLLLTGGEVFMRKDFKEIYENLSGMGFKITIYTNASLIDAHIAKWLGRIPPTALEITLYGASPETYDKICGNAKAYDRTIQAVDLLLDEGINLELKTTLVKDNVADFFDLTEFAYKRGKPLSIVDYLFPIDTVSCVSAEYRLSPEEMFEFKQLLFEKSSELIKKYSMDKIQLDSNEYREKLIQDLYTNDKAGNGLKDNAFMCFAGSSDFWITWNGHMKPCGVMEDVIQYPLKVGFVNAWKALVNQCDQVPVCGECRECENREYCVTCPAKLKAETGYFDQSAAYLCKSAKLTKVLYLNSIQS
jgi:MoaA/NifB/PqqE/SkfB family radical SAM enzyme